MYSIKIKNNNLQNLFSVLDNTVPGSSPYAINKTVSNSDNGFCANLSQSITAPTINLIQGSTPERFTIGTTVTSGSYRYVWFFRTGGSLKRQIANISFSNGSIINSLPANLVSTGYVSYNHPDSSVYTGSLINLAGQNIPLAITVYDTNLIPRATTFICTQIGVLFVAIDSGGGTNATVSTTLVNVGESLASIVGQLSSPFLGDFDLSPSLLVDEITNLPSTTVDYGSFGNIVVYSTAIFSITY